MRTTTRSQSRLHKLDEPDHRILEGESRHDAFWLSLPIQWSSNNPRGFVGGQLDDAKNKRPKSDVSAAPKQDSAKPTAQTDILVVEDNPANQKVLKMQLAHLGFEADIVSSGQAAIDALTSIGHSYKLVLMDVQMPGMDGLTATQKIREWERGRSNHVRIVAVTAGAMPEDRDNCLSAGMDDFLTKPLRLDTLRQILAFLREE